MTRSAFDSIIKEVSAASPLQAKAIGRLLADASGEYKAYADSVCEPLLQKVFAGDASRLASHYVDLCNRINEEQFWFKKSGCYRANTQQTQAKLYSDDVSMEGYIVGLLLSYLLWKSHFHMIEFFRRSVSTLNIQRYLEVGVGHGLLTREVLLGPAPKTVRLVDISAASLSVARRLLEAMGFDCTGFSWEQLDILEAGAEAEAELVVMGEVIEHVPNPGALLAQARRLIAPGGRLFMSTCANCPAPDHVYLFRDVEEIRSLCREAGLRATEEFVEALEPKVPPSEWARRRVNVNYAAFLVPVEQHEIAGAHG